MSASIWTTLGVQPAADRATIRRAYAARLRETSPEDDPSGFQALREAYELALAAVDGAGGDQAVLAPSRARAGSEQRVGSERGAAGSAEGPDHWDLGNALAQAIGAEASEAELLMRLDAICGAPFMEEVSLAHEVACRVAMLVAATLPVSDPLVDPVLDRFGWRRGANEWGARPEILALLDRSRVLQKRRELLISLAGDGVAYRLLTAPPSESRRRRSEASNVAGLLRRARGQDGWLLPDFDPATVADWDTYLRWRPFWTIVRRLMKVAFWFAVVIGVMVFAVWQAESRLTPPAAPPRGVQNR